MMDILGTCKGPKKDWNMACENSDCKERFTVPRISLQNTIPMNTKEWQTECIE